MIEAIVIISVVIAILILEILEKNKRIKYLESILEDLEEANNYLRGIKKDG